MANQYAGRTSLRAFARMRGVTVQAVREHINKGHLTAIGRDVRTGHPYITDPDLAMRQWDENVLPNPNQVTAGVRALPGEALPSKGHPDGRDQRPVKVSPLAAIALRQKQVQVRLAELELMRKAGLLVDARRMVMLFGDATTEIQQSVTALTSRLRQLQPDLPAKAYADLDVLIAEALESLTRHFATLGLPLFATTEETTNGHGPANRS